MRLRARIAFCLALALGVGVAFGGMRDADAQYKNGQFGFEGGYMFLGEDSGLDSHGVFVGLRGAYKAVDDVWLSARAGVSFRGERELSRRTVVIFHLMPVDARYYFATDSFRPFVGVTNAFHFLFNQSIETSVMWGPGVTGGAEFRLRRDLFLAAQVDAYWMFVFEGSDAPAITTTLQVNFFL